MTSNFTVKIAAPEITTPTAEQVFDPGTTTVNITGSAVPNAAISVTLAEGADPITATVGADGAWTVAAPATEGAHTATVTQTLNGQTSVPATVAFSVAAAVQATITAPAADAIVIAESGKITVTGTNVAGQTVKVTGPEGDIVDATVTGTTWTAEVNATADKADAVITAQATYTSTAFAVPEPASVTVLLLTQVPAPSVDVPAAGTALDAGTTTTTITGTALAGATVNVTVNGGDAQTVTADENGRWTLTAAAVQQGNNTVSATQTFSGQTSVAGTGDIMVTPNAPVITTPAADTELPAGTKAATISGTGLAGASIVATVDGTALDAVTVAADGTWTAEATVAAGAHTVTAVQSVGTIASAATAATAFTVALAVPVLTAPTVAQEFPAGTATVTLSGTAADGNAVTIDFADDTADLTVDVTDGAWTTDLPVVPGDYTFTVKAIIKDTTSASATLSGTFTVALADPKITTPAADGTRVLTTDGATTISGAVPEGATGVQVALDGSTTPVAATIDGATWSLALTGLAAGEHSVKVQAQGARNAVSAEVTRTFVIKAALVAPTVTTPDADGKIVWTTDGKATISGAATSGSEVAVTLDDAAAPLVAPVTDGAWSLELTGLTDASHKVSVIARDADGDVSPAAERTFTAVDRAAAPIVTTPAEDALLPAGTTTTTIAGTSQAGDIITMTAATGDKTYTATADATGAWSIADVAVVDGANSFSISADRGEGNISPSVSITVTVDTVAAPVITSPAQGEVLPGGTASADIKGTAEKAGDTVKVSVNGAEPVSVTVGDNLEWVLAGATVKAGDNHVSVQAARADGVSSTVERNFAVYAIAAPIVIEPTSGAELALGTTVVKFAGIATPGDTITILKDGKPVATGSVGVNFLWEIAEVPVAGGDNAFQVVASRGGVDSPPVDISVKVQTQAGTPVITSPQAGAKLDAGTTAITVTGTGTAGDTVGVNNGAGGQYSAVVAEDGTWSVEGVAVKTGLNHLAVQAARTGSLDSPIVRLEVTVKEPAPVLYKTVTSDNLYRITGSGAATRAVAITFEEWAEYGFPAPRAYPSAYVKYSWSNDIYAVQFWNTAPEAWTWQRLTPADWAKSNYAEPGIAGWIAGTTLHKWGTSPELFATLNGVTHKLTVNEWAAMNYANFDNRSDQGFGRVAGSSVVYKMSSVSGNRGTPITLEQWIAEGMPTPATLRSMPRP
ncbi:hypothetical protein JT358_12455 [Micrococcales bacterium 31B]|nr:hypothetical protein [Micrococcales bacterium 31B]